MSKQIKVLIIDYREVTRTGLQTLCGRQPDLELVGEEYELVGMVAPEAGRRADVAIIFWPAMEKERAAKRRLARHWLAYGHDDRPAWLFAALAAGAAGYVHEETPGERLAAALRVAAGGDKVWTAEQMAAIRLWQAEVYERWQRLSEREQEVLGLLSEGASNKEIARRLVVSVKTVEAHVHDIFAKLGTRSRSEAVAWLLRHGLEVGFGEQDAGPASKDQGFP